MNSQLLENKSTIQPKKGSQRNPYVGQLHPQTKKRHGKGNFQYQNKFFQFDGNYINGKKQGFGTLKMNDGTIIQATFINDQITGRGKITYSDGSVYQGQLLFGQKHGSGSFESMFEKYEGEWKQNSKQGKGRLQILSTGQVIEGEFHKNKLHGKATLKSYNYCYTGDWKQGKKQGFGQEVSTWRRISEQQPNQDLKEDQKNKQFEKKKNYDSYQYQGQFSNDQFNGKGKFCSKIQNYIYEGQFVDGLPKNYPNQYRIYISSNVKDESGLQIQTQKTLLAEASVLEYQLQSDSKNIYVQCVYQGPQYLDENQLTQEQIEQLIKNWQNQNKKNKNPPPMPDFRTPKMKKPELILITQENHRQLQFILQKQGPFEGDNKMKIDYRQQISQRRAEIQKIKQQQKKNQEQDPKKKGSKKEAKNENQFKINLFNQQPKRKEKTFNLETFDGVCCFKEFELPDDFPQGKFFITIKSDFQDFGKIKPRKIQIIVKSKQPAAKKK